MDFVYAVYVATMAFQIPSAELKAEIPYAMGNWTSCQTFAFFGQGSRLSSALYNGCLALYYLLTVRYGWTESQCKKIEPWLHVVPLTVGWATAIACLPLGLFNPVSLGCKITPYPMRCQWKGYYDSDVPCERGANATLYDIAFFHVWLWAVFIWLVVAMAMMYQQIARTERSSNKYRSESVLMRHYCNNNVNGNSASFQHQQHHQDNKKVELRKAFRTQALLYCSAYFITWLPATLHTIFKALGNPIFALTYAAFLDALQGFWNAIIYIRVSAVIAKTKGPIVVVSSSF